MLTPSSKRTERGMWWDRAWKLVSGCTKASEACDHCWSARETHMRSFHPNELIAARNRGLTCHSGQFNGQIRKEWDALRLPFTVKTPTVWAVWNDIYHPAVSWNFIYNTYEMMWTNPRHLFIVLTKRPERMEKIYAEVRFHFRRNHPIFDFSNNNIIHGTTVENQHWADIRIPELLKVPGPKMLSVEPMLGPVDLRHFFDPVGYMSCGGIPECECRACKIVNNWPRDEYGFRETIDLVICGCESGQGRRPMQTEWAIDLREQCRAAGVSFFMKVNLQESLRRIPSRPYF